ncbi:MAG: phosphate ABC transporter ATP-binding protein [Candidatus Coatesbacteria bacterium]|nr:MAG: phosphate ABC transporter ATP-binding protein [Candidatus Coatesbacteria bacterium]
MVKNKVTYKEFKFWYGDFQALFDIDMGVPENSVVAIIGPSGCGKSTLIKSVNRIAELDADVRTAGEIILDDENICEDDVDLVTLRRRVGMVFQRPNPFPKSIYDNVAFGPRLFGIRDRSKLDEIVERSLKRAALWKEVEDRLRESALRLSGGQQQRLCIARALSVEPEVLLMDEPASALDPTSTQYIEDLIFELKENYTIIIVTHNMQQAARISDWTAFMLHGRIEEFNDTEQIFTRPDKEITEDYITGRFG